MARDAVAVLDHVGIAKAAVVGCKLEFSFGRHCQQKKLARQILKGARRMT